MKQLIVSIQDFKEAQISDNDLCDLVGERLHGLIDLGNLDATHFHVDVLPVPAIYCNCKCKEPIVVNDVYKCVVCGKLIRERIR